MEDPRVCFVYNAEKGWFRGVSDTLHKLWSPQTYSCDLCRITHGLTGMRKEIRSFTEQASIEMQFYHLDELTPEMEEFVKQTGGAPVVMFNEGGAWKSVFTAADLKKISGPTEFITSLRKQLNSLA